MSCEKNKKREEKREIISPLTSTAWEIIFQDKLLLAKNKVISRELGFQEGLLPIKCDSYSDETLRRQRRSFFRRLERIQIHPSLLTVIRIKLGSSTPFVSVARTLVQIHTAGLDGESLRAFRRISSRELSRSHDLKTLTEV